MGLEGTSVFFFGGSRAGGGLRFGGVPLCSLLGVSGWVLCPGGVGDLECGSERYFLVD